jgi:hypothetical protein
MFRGSEKGLKEDPYVLGVLRVRSREIMNHANEAHTRNQTKLKMTLKPIVISDSMDAQMQPGST